MRFFGPAEAPLYGQPSRDAPTTEGFPYFRIEYFEHLRFPEANTIRIWSGGGQPVDKVCCGICVVGTLSPNYSQKTHRRRMIRLPSRKWQQHLMGISIVFILTASGAPKQGSCWMVVLARGAGHEGGLWFNDKAQRENTGDQPPKLLVAEWDRKEIREPNIYYVEPGYYRLQKYEPWWRPEIIRILRYDTTCLPSP